jgi:phosphohistidine phosphatase
MRRLIIFRHAKAVPHGSAPDFDRALAPRGVKDATAMGRMLADEQLFPDLVLVSPALRTRQTWEHAAQPLGPVEVRFEETIYNASTNDLLALVRHAPPSARTLMLVGHNPSMSDLARSLIGHGDRYAYARLREKFPTAAIAVVDLPSDDWTSAGPGAGRLDRFVTPEGAVD